MLSIFTEIPNARYKRPALTIFFFACVKVGKFQNATPHTIFVQSETNVMINKVAMLEYKVINGVLAFCPKLKVYGTLKILSKQYHVKQRISKRYFYCFCPI